MFCQLSNLRECTCLENKCSKSNPPFFCIFFLSEKIFVSSVWWHSSTELPTLAMKMEFMASPPPSLADNC